MKKAARGLPGVDIALAGAERFSASNACGW